MKNNSLQLWLDFGCVERMTPATIVYLPPPHLKSVETEVFVDNLLTHPPKYPLMVYSEHDWEPRLKGLGRFVKLKDTPEKIRDKTNPQNPYYKWTVNNYVFLTGVSLADRFQYSHICYLEADCRLGVKHWDEVIFNEFFSFPNHCCCAGSLVVWNPSNSGMAGQRRWQELISRNSKKNFPIPTYGNMGSAKSSGSSVFPNGALGVYDVTWLKLLLADLWWEDKGINTKRLINMFAWDFYLGQRIWDKFREDSYEMVGHMNSVYSSYGEVLTTEGERIRMLKEGKVVGVHQVKSKATV